MTDQLSTTFAALADPTRRAILARLASGQCSVTELAEPFAMSLPAVSKHLRVLREVGLVRVRDEGRQRFYRLDAGPLRSIARWLVPFERAMSERFDLMDDVIQELKAQEDDDGDDDQLREGHAPD